MPGNQTHFFFFFFQLPHFSWIVNFCHKLNLCSVTFWQALMHTALWKFLFAGFANEPLNSLLYVLITSCLMTAKLHHYIHCRQNIVFVLFTMLLHFPDLTHQSCKYTNYTNKEWKNYYAIQQMPLHSVSVHWIICFRTSQYVAEVIHVSYLETGRGQFT